MPTLTLDKLNDVVNKFLEILCLIGVTFPSLSLLPKDL